MTDHDQGGLRYTRVVDLLTPGLVVALVVYLLLRLAYGELPPLPRLAGTTLAVLAVVEAVLGRNLRNKINSGTIRPGQALTAARAVALAKASSLVGAMMLGAWLGVLIYTVPLWGQLEAAEGDVITAVVGAVCAALLIAAALWLEYCCRTPDDRHEADDPGRAP